MNKFPLKWGHPLKGLCQQDKDPPKHFYAFFFQTERLNRQCPYLC